MPDLTRECRLDVLRGSPTGLRRIADMVVVVKGVLIRLSIGMESACMNVKFKGVVEGWWRGLVRVRGGVD